MLPDVQRATIEPLIRQRIQRGSRVYTDYAQCDIYTHKPVNIPATTMATGSMKSMSTRLY